MWLWIYEDNSKKICLGKNGQCPQKYPVLVGDTNQCKDECPSDYANIDNICLKGFSESSFWYYDEQNKRYDVLSSCTQKELYQIENSTQCVKNCKSNNYNVYLKLKGRKVCASNCESLNNTKVIRVENSPISNF